MKIIKNSKKQWRWFAINIAGLSTALACVLIIFLFVMQEQSYDRFHSKANRIYRLTTESINGATTDHPARVAGEWPNEMPQVYPEIEKVVRLISFENAIIKIGENKFYSKNVFCTDSTFFDVFDFPLLSGNPETAFKQPGQIFIARSMALKFFGTTDVIGKEISIQHQQNPEVRVYTIQGVMEDFPENSHFHASLLTSSLDGSDKSWAYTYLLMKENTDVENLKRRIQTSWDEENESEFPSPTIFLQKLPHIHLYSHKSREMEKNGDILTLLLLSCGALIILFIALLNFVNLNNVQLISAQKILRIKQIHGATIKNLALDHIKQTLFLACFAVLVGGFFALRLSRMLSLNIIHNQQIILLLILSVSFILAILFFSVIPLFITGVPSEAKKKSSRRTPYVVPLIVQYTLAVIAIVGTLVLHRQMNYLNHIHPEANNANMIVIKNNPWMAVQRYEQLKNELLSNPSIKNVTSAMEEPGGDILDHSPFTMEGIEQKEGQTLSILTIDSNFFKTMGIEPLAGTIDLGYTPSQEWEKNAFELSKLHDSKSENHERIKELEDLVGNYREKYILNASALKELGIENPQDAVGKNFRLDFFWPDIFPQGDIVAVVPDFHYTNLHNEEKPLAIVSRKMFNYCFLISINAEMQKEALATLYNTWNEINPEYPLEYEYITDSYRIIYGAEYAQMRVISLFALLSILISALGIFAMAAFSMQRRVKEIGIRRVNGATVANIIVLLNKDFVALVFVAFAIATPIAWWAMHKWLENFAYKTVLSWWIFALAGVIVLTIAMFTVSTQSWFAATRNPVESLRDE